MASDIGAFFTVPAEDLDKHIPALTNKEEDVLDKYTFKDLREGKRELVLNRHY